MKMMAINVMDAATKKIDSFSTTLLVRPLFVCRLNIISISDTKTMSLSTSLLNVRPVAVPGTGAGLCYWPLSFVTGDIPRALVRHESTLSVSGLYSDIANTYKYVRDTTATESNRVSTHLNRVGQLAQLVVCQSSRPRWGWRSRRVPSVAVVGAVGSGDVHSALVAP